MVDNFQKIKDKNNLLNEVRNSNIIFDKNLIEYKISTMNCGYTFYDKNEKFLIIIKNEERDIFNPFESITMEVYALNSGLKVSDLYAEVRSGKDLYLSSIDTMYRYSRRGYASRLLQLLIEYARCKKLIEIHGAMFLGGNIDNLKNFYQKNGFEVKKSSFKMYLEKI